MWETQAKQRRRRPRVMLKAWKAKVETWAWQTRAEMVVVRTVEEFERSRIPSKPEGWRVETQLMT